MAGETALWMYAAVQVSNLATNEAGIDAECLQKHADVRRPFLPSCLMCPRTSLQIPTVCMFMCTACCWMIADIRYWRLHTHNHSSPDAIVMAHTNGTAEQDHHRVPGGKCSAGATAASAAAAAAAAHYL
eukprot:jgi/Chrzof1/5140/Cz15g13020.t1